MGAGIGAGSGPTNGGPTHVKEDAAPEWSALGLLVIGYVLHPQVPPLGVIALTSGVVLVLVSRRWTVGDKLLGILAATLPFPVLMAWLYWELEVVGCNAWAVQQQRCTPNPLAFTILVLVVLALWAIGGLVGAFRLLRRLVVG